MSESMFPFSGGGTAVTDAPAQEAPVEVPAEAGNRNRLLALGGVAVLLVLAVVGYFLFFAGSEPAPAPAPKPVTPVAPGPAAGSTDGSDGAVSTTGGKKINQRNFGHDPFHALIVEEPVAPVVTDPAVTTDGTSTPTTTDPGTTTGSSTDGVTTPTPTQAHTFKVVEVAPDNSAISVKLDGKVYRNLKAGEVFATYFKVVLISGTTNAFQYGEEKFNVLGTKRLTIA